MQRTSFAPLLSATSKRVSCCIITTWLFNDFYYPPVLGLAQRTGFHDADGIALTALVLLVVCNELGGLLDKLAIEGMLLLTLDGDHDGLVHLAADHYSYSFLAKISFHGISV